MHAMRVGLGSILCFAFASQLASPASAADGDAALIRARAPQFVAAWNRHDPAALALLFTEDGDLTTPDGRHGVGRAAIQRLLAEDLTGAGPLRDSTFEVKSDLLRFVTADVASEDWQAVVTGAYAPDGSRAPPLLLSIPLVVKKIGSTWLTFGARPREVAALDPTPPPGLEPAPSASATAGVRGEWGGDMSKAKLSDKVQLDEMFVSVPAGGDWKASIRLNCTVHTDGGDLRVVILGNYADGAAEGASVRWAKVPWHRTVIATLKKDDINGNPLRLSLTPDGRLSGEFEGSDGFTFTLGRKGGAPAATKSLDAAVGTWGGDLHVKLDDGTVESLVVGIDKTGEGAFDAGTRGVYTVQNAQKQPVRIVIVGRYSGKVEGDKIVFHSTSRKLGLEGSDDMKDQPAGVLEVSLDAGKIVGRLGSVKGGFTTFTLAPKVK